MIVVKPIDGGRQDFFHNPWIHYFPKRKVTNSRLEVITVGVDAPQKKLVPQYPFDIDLVGWQFRTSIPTRDTGPDKDPIVSQLLHGIEGDMAGACRIDNQIRLANLGRMFFDRRVGKANVFRFHPFDNFRTQRWGV